MGGAQLEVYRSLDMQPGRGLSFLPIFVFLPGHEVNGSTMPRASSMTRPINHALEPMDWNEPIVSQNRPLVFVGLTDFLRIGYRDRKRTHSCNINSISDHPYLCEELPQEAQCSFYSAVEAGFCLLITCYFTSVCVLVWGKAGKCQSN